MEYPAGTTHISSKTNNATGYKILIEPFLWFFTKEQVYFYDVYRHKWVKGAFSSKFYGLVKLNDS